MGTKRKTLETLAGILAQRLGGEYSASYPGHYTDGKSRYYLESWRPGRQTLYRFCKYLPDGGTQDNVIISSALPAAEFEQVLRAAINAVEWPYREREEQMPKLDEAKIPHWSR